MSEPWVAAHGGSCQWWWCVLMSEPWVAAHGAADRFLSSVADPDRTRRVGWSQRLKRQGYCVQPHALLGLEAMFGRWALDDVGKVSFAHSSRLGLGGVRSTRVPPRLGLGATRR